MVKEKKKPEVAKVKKEPKQAPLMIEISEKYFKVNEVEPENKVFEVGKQDCKIYAVVHNNRRIDLLNKMKGVSFTFEKSKPETIQAIGELIVMASKLVYKNGKNNI